MSAGLRLWILCGLAALTAALGPGAASAGAATALQASLDRLVRTSGIGLTTSVTVLDAGGHAVYDHRDAGLRIPASNMKLLTLATALDRLGPGARLTTRVVTAAQLQNGVLSGPLTLVGDGDPTLSTTLFARANYKQRVATLQLLVRRVVALGIHRIRGPIYGDGSVFDRRRAAPGWKPGFLGSECPPLSGLSLNRNPSLRTAPELAAARAFRRALVAHGIAVPYPALVGRAAPRSRVIARVSSPTIAQLAAIAGKESDNFIAEMLLKRVAVRPGVRGTTAGGVAAVRAELASRSLAPLGLVMLDGSGLAYGDRVSTRLLTRLLVAMAHDPRLAAPYFGALAIAGVDGTLKDRMTSGPAYGVVHAKTGTLDVASALSGYARGFRFSVITSSGAVNVDKAHRLQDAIAQRLAR